MPHKFVFKLTITHLNFVKQISRFLFMACTSRSKPKPLHTLAHTLIFCITWKLAEKWRQRNAHEFICKHWSRKTVECTKKVKYFTFPLRQFPTYEHFESNNFVACLLLLYATTQINSKHYR